MKSLALKLSVICILALVLVGCGTSSTGKLVAGYKIATSGVYYTDQTVQSLKDQNLVTVEQMVEYEKLYKELYRYAGLTRDALKLYIETEDVVEKKLLKEKYTELLNKYLELGDRLVILYHTIKGE